jgi:hypothetical protein
MVMTLNIQQSRQDSGTKLAAPFIYISDSVAGSCNIIECCGVLVHKRPRR